MQHLIKLKGGKGQALPGLIVERLLPSYLPNMLRQLPEGVVVITGTNGKTTTTKLVVELLRLNGKRVLTNPTGSNFTRGIISSLSQQARPNGHLPFDIGVFELDEAYARHFVKLVTPRWVVALNVMRDQLDRFGELDLAARMVGETLHAASEGIVVNGDDSRLNIMAKQITTTHAQKLHYFGVAPHLRRFFPGDDDLVAANETRHTPLPPSYTADVQLADFKGQQASFIIGDKKYDTSLLVTGIHNFQNVAAALTLVKSLLPNIHPQQIIQGVSKISPAFGRGQRFNLKDGSTLELLLVKNPAGLRQTLASYPVTKKKVMFAINDNYADSRDVSWLWDVDFSILEDITVPIVTGTRAADMALRLHYDDIDVSHITPNLDDALKLFCEESGDKLLITTYTAMLRFYKLLEERAGKTL